MNQPEIYSPASFPGFPSGIAIRRPVMDDLAAVAALVIACDMADLGHSEFNQDELLNDWQSPGFVLEEDAWVAVVTGEDQLPEDRTRLPAGAIVGYEELWNRADHAYLMGDGYVHPDFVGLGIGTALLRLLNDRAREHVHLAPPGRRVYVRSGVSGADRAGQALHENEGYRLVRHFWHMRIDLNAPPDLADWPEGISVRTYNPADDPHPVFAACEEAFQDHWGYTKWDYEEWHHRMMEREGFDPALWFLAIDGEQIAGAALCEYHEELGWVQQLAVRRQWRRQGLGLALLRHAFADFFRRGTTAIGLGVDSNNTTGATRLYERAGMYVQHQFIVYEKEFRPGDE